MKYFFVTILCHLVMGDFTLMAQTKPMNEARVRQYVKLYFSQKFDKLQKNYLDPEVKFLESSGNATFRGIHKVVNYWKKTFENIKNGRYEVQQLYFSGSTHIMVHGIAKFAYQAKALGGRQEGYIHFSIPMSFVLKVRNNKIVYQADYTDSKRFMAQLRAQLKK